MFIHTTLYTLPFFLGAVVGKCVVVLTVVGAGISEITLTLLLYKLTCSSNTLYELAVSRVQNFDDVYK